jgi:hypothetical protein
MWFDQQRLTIYNLIVINIFKSISNQAATNFAFHALAKTPILF